MDTKTIMAALALLGSGTLHQGCDDAAENKQAPEDKATSPAPVKTEPVRAQSQSRPVSTAPPAAATTEAVRAQPESRPAGTGSSATAEAERTRSKSRPVKIPAPTKVEAKEVAPTVPNRTGQAADDTKGEMKCGEGKCGAAPNSEP